MRPCMESNAKTGGDQRERSECLPVAHACTFRRLHCRHVRFQPPHIHKNGDNFPNKERDNEKNTNLISLLISRKKKKRRSKIHDTELYLNYRFRKKRGEMYLYIFSFLLLIIKTRLLKTLFHELKK